MNTNSSLKYKKLKYNSFFLLICRRYKDSAHLHVLLMSIEQLLGSNHLILTILKVRRSALLYRFIEQLLGSTHLILTILKVRRSALLYRFIEQLLGSNHLFFFQLFLLPQEMYLHHPGGFLLYIYSIYVQYYTALNRFYGSLP